MYPMTLSTPSESGLSSLPIDLLSEIESPTMQFAGLENNQPFETEDSCISDHNSASPRLSANASPMDYSDRGMEELITYDEDNVYSPTPLYTNDQNIVVADPMDELAYHQPGTMDNALTDWELLFNADQMSNIDYQVQVLGSPLYWDGDPGASDVALD
jgi:hypothetical protein